MIKHDNLEIHHGDCIEVMRGMEPGRFSSVITDPPYGLKFMGKQWDHGVPGVPFWTEIMRVCKPGSMLLAFGGTRTFHRLACAVEDAGWEIRDCVMWLYGSGFPKSHDISKAIDKANGLSREKIPASGGLTANRNLNDDEWNKIGQENPVMDSRHAICAAAAAAFNGWGTALKPAWEPIIVAMKPLDGTFAENAQKHGVAGFNIDGSRISAPDGVPVFNKRKELTDNCFGDGLNGRNRTGEIDTNTGRWPANMILDEESATALDQQTGTLSSGKCPDGFVGEYKANVFGKYANNQIDPKTIYADSGGASRFFYCAKTSPSERGWYNKHPTVKPVALMKYLINLVKQPTDGEMLDPFAGSFSTLLAAKQLGRKCCGIERDEEACMTGAVRLGVMEV